MPPVYSYLGREYPFRIATPFEAMEMLEDEENYIVLDVRSREEFEEGHIEGAICIPNEAIGTTPPKQLPDKDQLIMVHCFTGSRSRQAVEKLAAMGYTNIVDFGGIINWAGELVTDNVTNSQKDTE